MPIFTVIAFSAIIIAVLSLLLAILGKRQFYWISALGIYVFSFIAGFSIGQLTVGLTFIPLTLATGISLGWLKSKADYFLTVVVGILIGVIIVTVVDDYYTFFPLWILSHFFDVLIKFLLDT
ncbi:hypothetical protein [Paenibacillus thermotolerans]|uniref:hypothetical protein n=1 Tax=Paenibacillus thermotolerans TaxID=3027807 RepID=UPI002367A555|nr:MULTISPECIES: hypothetical protein [unclassified Paenibacillus]